VEADRGRLEDPPGHLEQRRAFGDPRFGDSGPAFGEIGPRALPQRAWAPALPGASGSGAPLHVFLRVELHPFVGYDLCKE